jgi:hypothetical protein
MAITQIKGSNIEDGTVVAADVADDAVTTAKILDGQITNAKVKSDAAIVTSKLSGAVTSITSHGLGTAATLTSGTAAGNVVVLDGTGKLPAVDGSALTSLPSGGGGWTEIESDTPTSQTLTWSSLNLAAYHTVRLEMGDIVRSANTRTELSISNDGFSNTNIWIQNGTTSFDNSGTTTHCAVAAEGNSTLTGGAGLYVVLSPHNVWASPLRWSGYIDFIVNENTLVMTGQGISTDDGPCTVLWSGMSAVTTFTDLKLYCFSGTFTSGNFRLLGMA